MIATTAEGLKSVKVYLQSLGRYGNSAYLCPLYGVGSELAQAFCRYNMDFRGLIGSIIQLCFNPLPHPTVKLTRCAIDAAILF